MTEDAHDKLKLMVVDDEPDNLALLYRTFRRDFDVVRAKSAIEALAILDQQGEMAIIISDQRMPEMLGTEFLSKTVNRFPDTIRIVLTGYTDVEDLVEAINAGKVFKYITKPWSPDQLKIVVQQAAETYRVVKQRTNELRRALRRESLFNAVTKAIHESLDYESMLHTIAATLGKAFTASQVILQPIEGDRLAPSVFLYQDSIYNSDESNPGDRDTPARLSEDNPLLQSVFTTREIQIEQASDTTLGHHHLLVPLAYQQDFLAVLSLQRADHAPSWSSEDIEQIRGVAEQASLAISQAKLYQRTQKQAEQMRAELEVARQIQGNLLRQSWPELDGMKVQACCYPAREVGGDFLKSMPIPRVTFGLRSGMCLAKGFRQPCSWPVQFRYCGENCPKNPPQNRTL